MQKLNLNLEHNQRPLSSISKNRKPSQDVCIKSLQDFLQSQHKNRKNMSAITQVEPFQKIKNKQVEKFIRHQDYRPETLFTDRVAAVNSTMASECIEPEKSNLEFSTLFHRMDNRARNKNRLSISTEVQSVARSRPQSAKIGDILSFNLQTHSINFPKTPVTPINSQLPNSLCNKDFKSYLNDRIKRCQIKIPEIKDENKKRTNSSFDVGRSYQKKRTSSIKREKIYWLPNFQINYLDFKVPAQEPSNSCQTNISDSRYYWENRLRLQDKNSKYSQTLRDMCIKGENGSKREALEFIIN